MILVTGGTGFIGQALARQLVLNGHRVRVLLRPAPQSPNLPRHIPVEVALCSLRDERGLRAAMKGVDAIFHLASAENASGRADLDEVDIGGAEAIAAAASQSGVQRIFMLSQLGADRASAYPALRAKALAEGILQHGSVPVSIIRSASVYGPNDHFTIGLVRLLCMSPGIFLLPGGGKTLLQPLWIEDLIACLLMALEDPSLVTRTIEIGGPEAISFKKIVQDVMQASAVHRLLLPVELGYIRKISPWADHNPRFPLSIYWLDTLATDRTCSISTLPHQFGLMPARFHQQLSYLNPPDKKAHSSTG
ncbi:MAG TPA: NAD(P)H-binding protein [Anaerolineaceae bacterium]|nr:NAD(P)H-binding protein [Anaerolineaceae bacterium]HQH86548.1 NAD(P)H-binding protein [Anaerolineaceae bacterium]